MNPDKPLVLRSRCMTPLVFDNDYWWAGCSDDAAYFARNKKRMFRFRNAFRNEWSEFGNSYQSVFVIRLAPRFRLRIGLPLKSLYSQYGEPTSDGSAGEQLADLCEEFEPKNSSSDSEIV
jgi:hypothetical protein